MTGVLLLQEILLRNVVNMSTEYLTTKELAALLRIKERKVYDLAASGTVPCSKATGKLLFPRDAVHAWLTEHQSGPFSTAQEPVPDVFLGSHDPLLDWALRESQCGIPAWFDGSKDGLNRFIAREGLACGLHVTNTSEAGWNTELVEAECAGMPVVLVEWAKRQRGLVFNPDLQPAPTSMSDLAGLTVTPRQAGAGAQSLFLKLLNDHGTDADSVNWVNAVRTENEAALSVLDGNADIAFGLQTLAEQYRLDFLPVVEERFDLLITRRAWFDKPMQKLIRFCQSDTFLQHANGMVGYDISGFGRVHYNGAA